MPHYNYNQPKVTRLKKGFKCEYANPDSSITEIVTASKDELIEVLAACHQIWMQRSLVFEKIRAIVVENEKRNNFSCQAMPAEPVQANVESLSAKNTLSPKA